MHYQGSCNTTNIPFRCYRSNETKITRKPKGQVNNKAVVILDHKERETVQSHCSWKISHTGTTYTLNLMNPH